jgi:hypothetical protein
MAHLIVPRLDEKPWPSLGREVCDFIEASAIFGPGDLAGKPAELSPEKRMLIHRAYQVYPKGHRYAGRRRFKRVGWSVRKGLAKTELLGWVTYAELHPQGPVRFDGWGADGRPIGRPVSSPYIPMLAYNKDQVEELAYGVLKYVCEEGEDAHLFDVTLERTLRLSPRGKDDGKAVPLAQSPNARDGARTTFQAFDEPHRMYLPRLLEAHNTMANNLPKRPAADAWSFYVGTAGQLGQKSIAEDLYNEAEAMAKGAAPKDARFFFFHRDAGHVHRGDKDASGHNLLTKRGRLAAIKEATGPDGEYGAGQFEDIAEIYDRPKTDKAYWERVQLNLWLQADRQAFDPVRVKNLVRDETIPLGSLVTAGFDGARFFDSTAIVLTDVMSGLQQTYALWERPADIDGQDNMWEIDALEVGEVVDQLMIDYDVWRFNGDPPHWVESMATWAGTYECVEEWWTQRKSAMAYAVRNYKQAISAGEVTFAKDDRLALNSPFENETLGAALVRHIGNAARAEINLTDDEGQRLWVLEKVHPLRKFDACMAAILSWEGRIKALQSDSLNTARRPSTTFKRLY